MPTSESKEVNAKTVEVVVYANIRGEEVHAKTVVCNKSCPNFFEINN